MATPANGVEAEVILFESLTALRAAPDDSSRGKIAYVGHAMKRTQDGPSYGHFVHCVLPVLLRRVAAVP